MTSDPLAIHRIDTASLPEPLEIAVRFDREACEESVTEFAKRVRDKIAKAWTPKVGDHVRHKEDGDTGIVVNPKSSFGMVEVAWSKGCTLLAYEHNLEPVSTPKPEPHVEKVMADIEASKVEFRKFLDELFDQPKEWKPKVGDEVRHVECGDTGVVQSIEDDLAYCRWSNGKTLWAFLCNLEPVSTPKLEPKYTAGDLVRVKATGEIGRIAVDPGDPECVMVVTHRDGFRYGLKAADVEPASASEPTGLLPTTAPWTPETKFSVSSGSISSQGLCRGSETSSSVTWMPSHGRTVCVPAVGQLVRLKRYPNDKPGTVAAIEHGSEIFVIYNIPGLAGRFRDLPDDLDVLGPDPKFAVITIHEE